MGNLYYVPLPWYMIFGLHEDAVRCIVNVTKRCVVCSAAKVYDPLGFATSVTFFSKVFLQTL